jgi:hypothetical protein
VCNHLAISLLVDDICVSPKGTTCLATKASHLGTCQAPMVTLMPPALRSFSTKEGGLHVPPHKVSSPLHTKSKGR